MDDKLLASFIESCKQSKHLIYNLKSLAIKTQNYEFAAEVRNLEKELFPTTSENQKELQKAKGLAEILSMFKYQVTAKTAWTLNEIFVLYHKNEKVTSDDYFEIQTTANDLFVD